MYPNSDFEVVEAGSASELARQLNLYRQSLMDAADWIDSVQMNPLVFSPAGDEVWSALVIHSTAKPFAKDHIDTRTEYDVVVASSSKELTSRMNCLRRSLMDAAHWIDSVQMNPPAFSPEGKRVWSALIMHSPAKTRGL